jgi:hypothetical protein
VRRIFGTVSQEEYAQAKERADKAGRSVLGQIGAEAVAYGSQTVLAGSGIADQPREPVAELCRIGSNINQLARPGHVQACKHGGLRSRTNDHIGVEAVRQLEKPEARVSAGWKTRIVSGIGWNGTILIRNDNRLFGALSGKSI